MSFESCTDDERGTAKRAMPSKRRGDRGRTPNSAPIRIVVLSLSLGLSHSIDVTVARSIGRAALWHLSDVSVASVPQGDSGKGTIGLVALSLCVTVVIVVHVKGAERERAKVKWTCPPMATSLHLLATMPYMSSGVVAGDSTLLRERQPLW